MTEAELTPPDDDPRPPAGAPVVRMALVVAYLGTPFEGWQRQPGRRTVQGELERAVAAITRRPAAAVVGAGRTDAGVHAAGQVAHLDLPAAIPAADLVRALNRALPDAIRVQRARRVAEDFHARRHARGKTYVYRVRWRPRRLPWASLRCATIPAPVDLARLAATAAELPGERDWASFTVTDPGPGGTVRRLDAVRVVPRRDGCDLEFVGAGFLRYQVRRLTGLLLEIAAGRRSPEELGALLARPRPGSPIRTAPAVGLSLERVWYRRPLHTAPGDLADG